MPRDGQPRPHDRATYRVLPSGEALGVEVVLPGRPPILVTGFGTWAEATRWIESHWQTGAPPDW
jgi:hypothetical protein